MRRIVKGSAMRAMDAYTIEKLGIPSLLLMERAAMAAADVMEKEDLLRGKVLVIAGNGNNGGDGIALARILSNKGFTADIYMPFEGRSVSKDCQKQIDMAKSYGLTFFSVCSMEGYSCIVDALFGVGLNRSLDERTIELVEKINACKLPVLAIDIPSGLCADRGIVLGAAVRAKVTVTFQFEKTGLFLASGSLYAGKVIAAPIGIEDPLTDKEEIFCLDKEVLGLLPETTESGNKGTFGKLLVIAGSAKMGGAAYLSAKGGFLTGVGMVRVFTSKENKTFLHTLLPEAIIDSYEEGWDKKELEDAILWADALVIGPGLGKEKTATEIFLHTLTFAEKKIPMLVDADGISILKEHQDLMEGNSLVLTPHIGEMSRLVDAAIPFIKENCMELARKYAKEKEIVLVLKDAKTVIAHKDSLYLHPYENAGMASAGTGDVLAGMIGGLMAGGLSPHKAAILGVYLHGLAGYRARLKYGAKQMMAGDLLEEFKLLGLKKGMEKEDAKEESYLR